MQVQNFRGFSGFRGLNVGFRVLLGDQFSGSGSGRGFKSRGRPPRVSGFRVLDYITSIGGVVSIYYTIFFSFFDT